MKNRIAIIDMGTNTFHLLVAEAGLPPRILYRERSAVKIGQGGINAGIITAEAQQRAFVALNRFRTKLDELKVDNVFAFGTSAIRSASNGLDFVAEAKKRTGIDTQVINGEEEAALIFEGVRNAVDLGKNKSLIVDVGGGSVEFIIANEDLIFWKHSFEVGGQRLLERFHRHDPILQEEISELNTYLSETLAPLFAQIDGHNPRTLVGVSGTFDTLSEIYCRENRLPYFEDEPETPLTIESFFRTWSSFVTKNRTERMAIPGMIEMRVDMIVVACCLIKLVMDHHSFDNIRVSTWSLKEGVMMRYLGENPNS